MKFSALLDEALRSAAPGLTDTQRQQARTELVTLLRAWIEIHEPDDPAGSPSDPQRVLLLQLLEELEDRVEIPIVE